MINMKNILTFKQRNTYKRKGSSVVVVPFNGSVNVSEIQLNLIFIVVLPLQVVRRGPQTLRMYS